MATEGRTGMAMTLSNQDLRLTVLAEPGGGIADFSMLGPNKFFYPVMRRAAHGESSASLLGCFFMAPWVNRIAGAAFPFAGQTVKLRATTAEGTAMHGDVRARAWEILDRTPVSARLACDLGGVADANWPWRCVVEGRYELQGRTLRIDMAVRNTDTRAMPAGIGIHPYFCRRLWSDRDEPTLATRVGVRYPLAGGVPTGPGVADELCAKLNAGGPVPTEPVDGVFGGYGGRSEITWAGSGVRLVMTSSANLGHMVLFTPSAPAGGGGGGGGGGQGGPLAHFCVEPQSAVNDAFNRAGMGEEGTGTVSLGPGESLEAWCELRMERLGG
jgi:aldose 1-epimerase